MRGRNRLPFVLTLAALLAACGGDGGGEPLPDAAWPDATVLDGGPAPDAPGADGGAFDAAGTDAGRLWCTWEACDPRGADTCPARAVCSLVGNTPSCIADLGMSTAGEPCVATTDCAHGLACFAQGDGGVCARLCCPGDSDLECGLGMRCAGTLVLVDGTTTDWWHCVGPRPCNVIDPSATCETGEGCYIVSPSGETDCRRVGTAQVGESCVEQTDCAGGLFCAGLATRICVRICSLRDAGGAPCPSSEGTCRRQAFSPDATGLCTAG